VADINLTTTAVIPTQATLSTMRGRLRRELHDEDEPTYRWTDDALDAHLQRATRELSLVLPREQKTTLNTTSGSRELSLGVLDGLVRVEAVEYPTGRWPPAYVQFSTFEATLTLLGEATPAGVEPVSVFWGGLHTLDESVSTLPAAAEDVVLTGAAGYAAIEWASFASNRANVAGTAAFESYKTWGEERLRQFREALRGFGQSSRLRHAGLYQPASETSRSTVQWPG
jgi:hypothetical protein